MPVVDDEKRCQGWLRLDLAFDWMHQGKARLDLQGKRAPNFTGYHRKAGDSIEQALLQFAQTPDREVIVANETGQLLGTLALLDLILADER